MAAFPELNHIQYTAKADLVYQALRQAVMDGKLKPGDKLNTGDLAAAMRVSRMPVREAIKRLQVEGVVDVIPHRGATVAMLTPEQTRDVSAVRTVLEGLAARLAASLAEPEDIKQLDTLCREMERLADSEDTRAQLANYEEFHRAIRQMSRNQVLRSIADNLADSTNRFREEFMSLPSQRHELLKEHQEIYYAIARRDPDAAERLARQHIERTVRLLTSYTMVSQDRSQGDK